MSDITDLLQISGLFPNIEQVQIPNLVDDSLIPQLNLAKLKQLGMTFCQGQEHLLKSFIENSPKLTALKVIAGSEDENAIYESLKNISNLKHLIHFNFQRNLGENSKRFCGLLKKMANNCQNLKKIGCLFHMNDHNSDIRQFFSHLKAFQALKRLSLWFFTLNNQWEDTIDVNQLFSFELFKGFSNITHLRLNWNVRMSKITDLYFKNTIVFCI